MYPLISGTAAFSLVFSKYFELQLSSLQQKALARDNLNASFKDALNIPSVHGS